MYKIKNLVIDKLTYVYIFILYVNFISVALITEKLMDIKKKYEYRVNKQVGGGGTGPPPPSF